MPSSIRSLIDVKLNWGTVLITNVLHFNWINQVNPALHLSVSISARDKFVAFK